MSYYDIQETSTRIRQLRLGCGYTQERAAGLLEIDRRSLSHIEKGTKGCSVDMLIRLAEVYGVSLDYLLLGRDIDGRLAKSCLEGVIQQLTLLMDCL